MVARNVHIEVTDAQGLVATLDGVMEVNLGPTIAAFPPISPAVAGIGVERTIGPIDATDPEGGPLTYSVTVENAAGVPQPATQVSPGVFKFTPAD